MTIDLRTLEEQLAADLEAARIEERLEREAKFRLFHPYPKQLAFIALTKDKREILFMAGTQCGKTRCGAFIAACHLTGRYPPWWTGKRFDHPVHAWAGSITSEMTMQKLQAELCGKPNSPADHGTGLIPREFLVGHTLSHGTTGAFNSILVKHVSGGTSELDFKAYEQGVGKWQSATLDFLWLDEEPPDDVYDEAKARLTGRGFIYITATPLMGMTPFIKLFKRPDSPQAARDRGVQQMGLQDAEHFSQEEKERRAAGYKAHLRRARVTGDPAIESGQIFQTSEEFLKFHINMPDLNMFLDPAWKRIWGVDFGHRVFAAALCAIEPRVGNQQWEKDSSIFYVLRVVRLEEAPAVVHCAAMKRIAVNVPVAWPHDGLHHEKGSGEGLTEAYRAEGLNMLAHHATNPDGGYHVEPGITAMDASMSGGRFKVSDTCHEFFEEMESYRRDENGKIIKENDHVLDAVRCAFMMQRFARAVPLGGKRTDRATRRGPVDGADSGHWGY
jgi:phage terminase large subunit-like protein